MWNPCKRRLFLGSISINHPNHSTVTAVCNEFDLTAALAFESQVVLGFKLKPQREWTTTSNFTLFSSVLRLKPPSKCHQHRQFKGN
jgi:hypothetical protein